MKNNIDNDDVLLQRIATVLKDDLSDSTKVGVIVGVLLPTIMRNMNEANASLSQSFVNDINTVSAT